MVLGVLFLALSLANVAENHVIHVTSTLDGAIQPCLYVPSSNSEEPQPLLVGLHPWSHGFDTFDEMAKLRRQAETRGWHYLQPHFRGPNRHPDACASEKARQDILDAVDYVCARGKIDVDRIYLAGVSGGGHMALVMASYVPERWAAVSAWCAITDLKAWHAESKAMNRDYWKDLEACCGGAPGASEDIDRQYEMRSSLPRLAQAKNLPLDLHAGIHDGHTGSVPLHHSLDAYNVVALARGDASIAESTMAALSKRAPEALQARVVPNYSRLVHFRAMSGPSRITIFEGGHEMLYEEACDWLAGHVRGASSGPLIERQPEPSSPAL